MKQNFFMLLAAVLLSSASAFAQSGNNESLLGDVNGDGRVDIVDVTTVIDIYLNTVPDTGDTITYYWYVGTTQPTAVNQPSAWKTSNKDAGFSETVNLTSGTTWFAYPNTWTYSAKDSSGDDFKFNAFVPASTKTSISGYTLLKMSLSGDERVTITFSK